MKHFSYLIGMMSFLLSLSFNGSAQSFKKQNTIKFPYKQAFQFDPIRILGNSFSIGYEKMLEENTSIKITGRYKRFRTNDFFDLYHYNGIVLDGQFKFYAGGKKKVFNGFYLGPFAQFKTVNFSTYSETNLKASNIFIGYVAGYQVPLSTDFTLDLFIQQGLSTASGDYSKATQPFDMYSNGIRMAAGVQIGLGL